MHGTNRTIPVLAGGYAVKAGRVYLPTPAERIRDAVRLGATVGPKGGVYVELPADRWAHALEPLLPFFARRDVQPIVPDLIPGTSWGSSLYNLLTPASWDTIRLPVIQARGNLCQICGEKLGAMECHEIWAYSLPPSHAPKAQSGWNG